MSWENITTIIVSILALVGVVVTNWGSNRASANKADTRMAVIETKIENLGEEVRMHNDFARRMPAIEEKIEGLDRRITVLEKKGE